MIRYETYFCPNIDCTDDVDERLYVDVQHIRKDHGSWYGPHTITNRLCITYLRTNSFTFL